MAKFVNYFPRVLTYGSMLRSSTAKLPGDAKELPAVMVKFATYFPRLLTDASMLRSNTAFVIRDTAYVGLGTSNYTVYPRDIWAFSNN